MTSLDRLPSPIPLLVLEAAGGLVAQQLVEWAVGALSAGADGAALVRLAGLDVGGTPRLPEALTLFRDACAELAIALPADRAALRRAYALWVSDSVLSGSLDRLKAVELVHTYLLTPLTHPANLQDWLFLCERVFPQPNPHLADARQAAVDERSALSHRMLPDPPSGRLPITPVRKALYELLVRCDKPEFEVAPADRSPCPLRPPDRYGRVLWRPVALTAPPDIATLAQALGAPVHQDIQDVYSSYLAGPVQCRHSGLEFVFMFGWDHRHLAQLLRHAARHVRKTTRAHVGPLVPIANTIEDIWFVVHNTTGAVLVQDEAHLPPSQVAASSVAQFLADCETTAQQGIGPDERHPG